MIWWSGNCLGIELKTRKGRLSPAQKTLHARLRLVGTEVEVCRSVDEVRDALERRQIPMNKIQLL